MKPHNSSREYLRELESAERKKKTKLIGGVVLLVAVLLATGVYLFPTFGLSKSEEAEKFQSFFVDNLSESQVKSVLSEAHTSILVRYNDSDELDTVRTYDDYLSKVLPKMDQASFEANSFAEDSLYTDVVTSQDDENFSDSSPEGESADTPQHGFNIRGQRNTREQIRFNILNYDAGLTYTLDYGDGRREEVSNSSRHAFQNPGDYNISLIVEGENTPRQIYASTTLTIRDKSIASTVQEKVEKTATAPTNTPGEQKTLATTESDLAKTDKTEKVASTEKNIAAPKSSDNPEEKILPAVESKKKTVTKPKDNRLSTKGPVLVPDVPPSFSGGKTAKNKFIRKNLRHPNIASDQKKEGRVVVQFVVDKTGKIQGPRIIRSLGTVYDQEVLRVLSLMPKWRAAKVEGENVSAYSQLSVSFRLVD